MASPRHEIADSGSEEENIGSPTIDTDTFTEEDINVLRRLRSLLSISNRPSLIHEGCTTCQQYDRAVVFYVINRVQNPEAAEESRGILEVANEIWLEHHIEDYRNFVERQSRMREFIERSMEESAPAPKVATEDEIVSLETGVYTSKDPSISCGVCLSDIEEGENFTKTKCSHLFHKECIEKWLKMNVKCPVCRRNSITGETLNES